ncbi:hypothetical protein [Klebsiella phage vB_KpnS_Uniso31]|uniref:Uncharacterized protein n=1 Tax=Klebsiella phage vB_KpnS_Uniso31 TaxID=2951200 RepID=A0A9E7T068_9CAUD|nr:hypothetical protein [Klebsiella phage vB_KpnS_Uniso31]
MSTTKNSSCFQLELCYYYDSKQRRSKNGFFNVGARFSRFYDGFGFYRFLRLCPL